MSGLGPYIQVVPIGDDSGKEQRLLPQRGEGIGDVKGGDGKGKEKEAGEVRRITISTLWITVLDG